MPPSHNGQNADAHPFAHPTLARFDGLVDNAGVLHWFSIEDQDESLLDEMWEVNTKGPLRLIWAAFPHLKAAAAGRVINKYPSRESELLERFAVAVRPP